MIIPYANLSLNGLASEWIVAHPHVRDPLRDAQFGQYSVHFGDAGIKSIQQEKNCDASHEGRNERAPRIGHQQ
jgi:hypothetical protein